MAFVEMAWPTMKGIPLRRAMVREPVPGEEAFDTDHNILSIGDNRLEKRLGCCLHLSVENDFSILVYDAEVHGPGVQVDATVELVPFGVEAQRSPPHWVVYAVYPTGNRLPKLTLGLRWSC